MRAALRSDASLAIGNGHVMRCLTLAEALRRRGATVHFVCRELPGHLCEMLEERGLRVHRLPAAGTAESPGWERDAAETAAALAGDGAPADWLIVDHYALDANWERVLRRHTRRLMVIDDLADRPHDCDLLLDQNLHPQAQARYASRVPPRTQLLLGPRYALLRPEFAQLRATPRAHDGQVRRVLISFGGTDPEGYTLKALDALELAGVQLQADVVVGANNPHSSEIKARCAKRGLAFHCNTSAMAGLMAQADLAIGAGGSTTWERCCLGLPAIVVAIAENQQQLSEAVGKTGAQLYLGAAGKVSVDNLRHALETVLRDPELLRRMRTCAQTIVDGRGTERVSHVLMPVVIKLRPATAADSTDLFAWRNAEEVRRYSHDPAPIARDTHQRWLAATLADARRILLIGESEGHPIGVLRYDLEGSFATTSVYLVPGQGGLGLGSELLKTGSRWLRMRHPEIAEIRAQVLAGNLASERAFEAAGYRRSAGEFRLLMEERA